MRTLVSENDQLTTLLVMKSSFGMRISFRSRVRTETYLVLRVLIQPYVPLISMTSPGLMDLSRRMMTPETRLEMTFWSPKPSPSPKAPENTARAPRGKPAILRVIRNAEA